MDTKIFFTLNRSSCWLMLALVADMFQWSHFCVTIFSLFLKRMSNLFRELAEICNGENLSTIVCLGIALLPAPVPVKRCGTHTMIIMFVESVADFYHYKSPRHSQSLAQLRDRCHPCVHNNATALTSRFVWIRLHAGYSFSSSG